MARREKVAVYELDSLFPSFRLDVIAASMRPPKRHLSNASLPDS